MYRMVFDVESIGLHGEGFAVGWVVIDDSGARVAERMYACDPEQARGTYTSHDWVHQNVAIDKITHPSTAEVRAAFWIDWLHWRGEGAQLWADCAWPVEARFLIACIEDNHGSREWNGPYPLHDIATLALAAGSDPLKTWNRNPDELPAHSPLMDARQSARILHMLLTAVG